MFTGIIEDIGRVLSIETEGNNLNFTISSNISNQFKIDQSVSHNGVCLTVVGVDMTNNTHVVTAIDETLNKSNLAELEMGNPVNLERSLSLNDRLDGHMVQGHVDGVAKCIKVTTQDGSSVFRFELSSPHNGLMVEKGSISVNGISLTLLEVDETCFSVAIIPYTLENTTFKNTKVDTVVNIEFDILGKYVQAQRNLE
jgi:riboflavin synthase